jgi:hypothetical protein
MVSVGRLKIDLIGCYRTQKAPAIVEISSVEIFKIAKVAGLIIDFIGHYRGKHGLLPV